MRDLGTLGGANSRALRHQRPERGRRLQRDSPRLEVTRAFLWTKPVGCEAWGPWEVRTAAGNGINNRREVVGAPRTQRPAPGRFSGGPDRDAEPGHAGRSDSFAGDINDATQVVGFSQTADGKVHAFLWTAGRNGGSRYAWRPTSAAFGISQTGEVVGASETAAGTEEAFLWTREGGMRSLGALDNHAGIGTSGVNTHRRVVGAHHRQRALSALPVDAGARHAAPAHARRRPGRAAALNEFGQIAGSARPRRARFAPRCGRRRRGRWSLNPKLPRPQATPGESREMEAADADASSPTAVRRLLVDGMRRAWRPVYPAGRDPGGFNVHYGRTPRPGWIRSRSTARIPLPSIPMEQSK